jgi:lysozyme family protein
MTLFDKALEVTLSQEGGVSNHAKDPGGLTQRGVTQARFDEYLRAKGDLSRSVTTITDEELRDLYFTGYWLPIGADALPPATALVAFDICVNSGVGTARRFLALTQDPITLSHMRLNHYVGLSTWPTFGKGWARRTLTVLEAALHVTGKGEVFVSHEPDGAETVVRRPFVWRIRGPRLDVRFTG